MGYLSLFARRSKFFSTAWFTFVGLMVALHPITKRAGMVLMDL